MYTVGVLVALVEFVLLVAETCQLNFVQYLHLFQLFLAFRHHFLLAISIAYPLVLTILTVNPLLFANSTLFSLLLANYCQTFSLYFYFFKAISPFDPLLLTKYFNFFSNIFSWQFLHS